VISVTKFDRPSSSDCQVAGAAMIAGTWLNVSWWRYRQGDVLVAGQAQGERQVLAQQVDRESDRLVSRCQECISLGAYGYPLAIKALHFVSVGG
jgi:hypothetical protein